MIGLAWLVESELMGLALKHVTNLLYNLLPFPTRIRIGRQRFHVLSTTNLQFSISLLIHCQSTSLHPHIDTGLASRSLDPRP